MRYIGPFFRMNSLSQTEITGQLFHLSKEAVRTIAIESKCGIVSSIKNYKKLSSIDISTIGNFSPLLCLYKKSAANFIHSKNSNGFDEDTFRKEINPTTNALMTLSLIELIDYYKNFKSIDRGMYSLAKIYEKLVSEQLDFYSENLRNTEGVFVDKKNLLENNYKSFNLSDKNKKFKFSDQSFMMVVYYVYAIKFPEDSISNDYLNFSKEILQMFLDFKEKLYDCSFEELAKTLYAINLYYSYSEDNSCKELIIDLTDFLINKFDEKDYFVEELDFTSLFAINLNLSYKHTDMISFLEKYNEIMSKLISLYDEDKEVFYKLSGKKELKYSCFDISFYFLALQINSQERSSSSEYKNMISSLYRKYFINSGLILSWPEAPSLDDCARYRGLSLNSSDMLDESYFRMPTLPSPSTSGVAPIFAKGLHYSKKKESFNIKSSSFDSYRNMFIYYMLIHFYKDSFLANNKLQPILESPSTTLEVFQDVNDREVDKIESFEKLESESPETTLIEPVDNYIFREALPLEEDVSIIINDLNDLSDDSSDDLNLASSINIETN